MLKSDKKLLVQAEGRAQKAADLILGEPDLAPRERWEEEGSYDGKPAGPDPTL